MKIYVQFLIGYEPFNFSTLSENGEDKTRIHVVISEREEKKMEGRKKYFFLKNQHKKFHDVSFFFFFYLKMVM